MSCVPRKLSSEKWYCAVSDIIVPTLLELTEKITVHLVPRARHIRRIFSHVPIPDDPIATCVRYANQQHMYWTIINLSYTSRRFALDMFKIVGDHGCTSLGTGPKRRRSIPWPFFKAMAYYETRAWLDFPPYSRRLRDAYTHLMKVTACGRPGSLLVNLLGFNYDLFPSFIYSQTHDDLQTCEILLYTVNKIASSGNDVTLSSKLHRESHRYIDSLKIFDSHLCSLRVHTLRGVLRGAIQCDNPTIASAALTSLASTSVGVDVVVPDGITTAQWALNYIRVNHVALTARVRKHGSLLVYMWFARVFYAFKRNVHDGYRMTPPDIIDVLGQTANNLWPEAHIARVAKTIVLHSTYYQLTDARYTELNAVFRLLALDERYICAMIIALAKHPGLCTLPVDVVLDIVGRKRIRESRMLQTVASRCLTTHSTSKALVACVAGFYREHDLCCIKPYEDWYITYVLYPLAAASVKDMHELAYNVVDMGGSSAPLLEPGILHQHYRQCIIDLFLIAPDHNEPPNVMHTYFFKSLLHLTGAFGGDLQRLFLLLDFFNHPRSACGALTVAVERFRALCTTCVAGNEQHWRHADCIKVIWLLDCIIKSTYALIDPTED